MPSRGMRVVDDASLELPVSEPRSACFAPHSSMYFDQFGKVRACCHNHGVYLGDVTVQGLAEIWASADAERLRVALEHDDYSAGCSFCAWQVDEGNDALAYARNFDDLCPEVARPRWPRQMEFALSNACNLACVMCNGDWSSTIRARREGRPPIEPAYGDSFFGQLAEFLPHLERVSFLGGEPFLGREPLRVMGMLAELLEPPVINITTNGTIRSPRVDRLLETLRPNIIVSLDGASAETFDRIRLGADFDGVMRNLDHFIEVLGPERVFITHCLMSNNWREFRDVLQIAEDRQIGVGVNVVRYPTDLSLYHQPVEALRDVVERLAMVDAETLTGPRRSAWSSQQVALRHHLDSAVSVPSLPLVVTLDGAARTRLQDSLERESGTSVCQLVFRDERVVSVRAPDWAEFLEPESWLGLGLAELPAAWERTIGARISVSDHPMEVREGVKRHLARLGSGSPELHIYVFAGTGDDEMEAWISAAARADGPGVDRGPEPTGGPV